MAEVILTKKDFEELVKEKFEATDMRWEGDELIITVDIDELETHEHKEDKKEDSTEDLGYIGEEPVSLEETTSEEAPVEEYKDLSQPESTEENKEGNSE